jgi:hypothetical protein
MNSKCPLCNSSIRKREYKNQINTLRASRSTNTLGVLDNIVGKLHLIKSLSQIDIYYFLYEIRDIQGIIIRKMSESFESRGFLEQGYGIKYLVGMIKGEHSRYNLKTEYEKKTLDRMPPKLETE